MLAKTGKTGTVAKRGVRAYNSRKQTPFSEIYSFVSVARMVFFFEKEPNTLLSTAPAVSRPTSTATTKVQTEKFTT